MVFAEKTGKFDGLTDIIAEKIRVISARIHVFAAIICDSSCVCAEIEQKKTGGRTFMDMTFTFTSQQAIDLAYIIKRNEKNPWLIRVVLAFVKALER